MNEFHYIDLDDAKSILQPRMASFCSALFRAVHEWNTDLAKSHTQLDEFGRAVFVNQLWYHHANGLHRDDDGIAMRRYGNGRYFTVDDRLVLRLKHADDRYKVWDHPTPRALARAEQRSFPTIPPFVHLDLGYRLDLSGGSVRDAMVILRSRMQQVWRWQVWGRPVREFSLTPRNLWSQVVYSHDDFSGAAQ